MFNSCVDVVFTWRLSVCLSICQSVSQSVCPSVWLASWLAECFFLVFSGCCLGMEVGANALVCEDVILHKV
jgi:hypothetical protein